MNELLEILDRRYQYILKEYNELREKIMTEQINSEAVGTYLEREKRLGMLQENFEIQEIIRHKFGGGSKK